MFDYAMYFVVNSSLEMSPGKVAAQVGHAVELICERFRNLDNKVAVSYDKGEMKEPYEISFDYLLGKDYLFYGRYLVWKEDGRSKIVLAANQEQWLELKQLPDSVVVWDAGRTEIEPGSETVIGFCPMLKSEAPEQLKQLRLLK